MSKVIMATVNGVGITSCTECPHFKKFGNGGMCNYSRIKIDKYELKLVPNWCRIKLNKRKPNPLRQGGE